MAGTGEIVSVVQTCERMNPRNKIWRRRFGLICIALAIVMLIAGETGLKLRLSGVMLLGYWATCLILTALAAVVAIADAARVAQELKDEQRSLLEETLRKIEQEKQSRDGSKRCCCSEHHKFADEFQPLRQILAKRAACSRRQMIQAGKALACECLPMVTLTGLRESSCRRTSDRRTPAPR